ncbi:MAG TPA: YibE/F family protein [Spirochaetota bacterium]|nr:YibE/F family protein [Spirochaetota bacterium]HSA13836.1 YibE/F family protein [Spirochaetota bacterium]
MNIPRYSRIILTAFASLSVFISASFIPAHARESGKYTDPRRFMRAKVERIERNKISHEYVSLVEVKVHLRVLDGEDKGKERIAVYRGEDDMPRDIFYKEGDTVFIGISTMDDADAVEQVSIYDVDNSFGIIILGALLVACIALVGRLRGFFSILSLIATIVLIFYVMVPLTLKGHSPLPIAVGTALFAIAISVPIILGLKRKTIAAALGASVGVILAAALALFSGWIMHLSGIVTNEMMTVFYASDVEVDLRGLALAGIVIAALGAIMDVCISIASAAEEIFTVHPDISAGRAFRSVMTVSSDMLGATVNTLLFAYVGSSLPLVLLIAMKFDPGMPVMLIFNYNPVLSELVKSAVGCIGMFLSMPVTAIICIELNKKKRASLN